MREVTNPKAKGSYRPYRSRSVVPKSYLKPICQLRQAKTSLNVSAKTNAVSEILKIEERCGPLNEKAKEDLLERKADKYFDDGIAKLALRLYKMGRYCEKQANCPLCFSYYLKYVKGRDTSTQINKSINTGLKEKKLCTTTDQMVKIFDQITLKDNLKHDDFPVTENRASIISSDGISVIKEKQSVDGSYVQRSQESRTAVDSVKSFGTNESDRVIVFVGKKKYELLERLGKGGTSEVFECIGPDKIIYAIKIIKSSNRNIVSAENIQEIKASKALSESSFIVQLKAYEYKNDVSKLYMVLEKADTDVINYINGYDGKRFDMGFIKNTWRQMLKGLQACHHAGIAHLDIKPENFLLVKGIVKLSDFGISRFIPKGQDWAHTYVGCGTLNYFAPELFVIDKKERRGEREYHFAKVGKYTDIWSLGIILYLMIYNCKSPYKSLKKEDQIRVLSLREPRDEIDFPEFSQYKYDATKSFKVDQQGVQLIKWCLSKETYQRPRVDELLDHPFLDNYD